MNRIALLTCAGFLALGLAGPVTAHHPPRMERCYSLTFTGRIERIEWRNPHVRLTVVADSGESHDIVWLSLQALGRAGIGPDTLAVGDAVTVTVGTREDVIDMPELLAAITRTSDGWEWSQVPQGC